MCVPGGSKLGSSPNQSTFNVPVPPVAFSIAVPSLYPLQVALVKTGDTLIPLEGSVMVTSSEYVHPLASVTTQL